MNERRRFQAIRRGVPFAVVAVNIIAAMVAVSLIPYSPVGYGGDASAPLSAYAADQPSGWAEVERLVAEQKFQAAIEQVAKIRESARAAGDDEQWARALIEEVKLRIALHGYETSVRFLRDQPWPDDPVHRAALELYYANALVTYAHAYSWEIRQRERIAGDTEVDLKAWTIAQIAAEAHRAYARVWAAREQWGDESIGVLARYIDQNDYPARIRGTLRDAVSYLWVELFADQALWRPEQSNELFRLDAAALAAGDPARSAATDLTDPRVHPVTKIGAVLDDLEAWHKDERRIEAALEARLERLRRLHAVFQQQDDGLAIVGNLETTLEEFDRSYDWWSMGQAQLAEFVSQANDPDALIRAREAALAGAERHPDSVGGQRCRHIAERIEAPAFTVEAMATDGPDLSVRRSLKISHRNLTKLYCRAWRYDLAQRIAEAEDSNLLPRQHGVSALMDSCGHDFAWELELPETADFRTHVTYSGAPLSEPGAYVVVVSARRDFARSANQIVAVNMIAGDLVLLTRPLGDVWEVTARSGTSGEPLADAEVLLYRADWRKGHQVVDRRLTGADGVVRFTRTERDRARYFLLARWREHVAVDQSYLRQYRRRDPDQTTSAFIYTDRSVYRPGQTVYWKVVAYAGGGEQPLYETLPQKSVAVTLRDANGETVAADTVQTNDFGSAAGEFIVPGGRLLGRWRLQTAIGGDTTINVEEYKRPTFEVAVDDPEAPLRLNRPAVLSGNARYYFGLPVVTGQVDWRITREPIYPRWWWWSPPTAGAQIVASGQESLGDDGRFSVAFTPEADEREAESEGVSYNYRLNVDVTDEGGETRSASGNFRLGFVAVQARITSDVEFFLDHEPGELTVTRSDLNGAPRAGRGHWRLVALQQPAQAVLPADEPLELAPETDDRYRTVGDGLRPRWNVDANHQPVLARWDEGREVAAGDLDHPADGITTLALPKLKAGAYRLLYETEDDFGAVCRARKEIIVAGNQRTPIALPLLLLAERASVPVGETARILVRSGLADQQLVLEMYRDGRRFSRRVLHAGEDDELIEIPVTAADRGGFSVTLTGLRDHQLMQRSQRIFVPWDDRRLTVEFATFRDRLRPGTRESFQVTVRGSDQQQVDAGTAELLAYMYDRSLDIFAPHVTPNPLALYPDRTGAGRVNTNLGSTRQAWYLSRGFGSLPNYPHLTGDRLKVFSGYGIGGPGRRRGMPQTSYKMSDAAVEAPPPPGIEAAPDMFVRGVGGQSEEENVDLNRPTAGPPSDATAEQPGELRTDFAETAFFLPHLLLDEDGAVTFAFEVPDAVTDWNVWVHALTRDLRAGSVERQTASVKELMVRPYLPRFLREGDRATIKVVVNNAGDQPLTGTVDFALYDPITDEDLRAAFGLDAAATTGVPFTVVAGGGSDLSFTVDVPARIGTVAFRVTAHAGQFTDGELRPLPVLPGRLHLMQSRFVTLHDSARRELHFADLAADDDPTLINDQLVVTVDAQLFYGVLNALPYLVDYPYECSEQLLNRFVSTGIVASLYDDYPAVARMAEQLSQRETRYESWAAPDPNHKLMLEESPWLVTARGGDHTSGELINVLDPQVARAVRDEAIAKLQNIQTSLGAFPWWPGGPPSPYLTLYILYGLSKALEFGVEVPRPMVVQAWSYLHRHYLDELTRTMMDNDCCWERITFLNYVLSNYPDESWTGSVFSDDDRRQMLDFSFGHWRRHTPLLKGYLALTLARAGRPDDARLVFDSVMDSAHSNEDLGTYWAPEDRAWLWYNDTIETHAFALRTLTELAPDDARRHGLVHWLFLNKKLNHWKSTRATAEVIYSLVHYLKQEGALAQREELSVAVGPRTQNFVFEPDEYTGGRNRLIVPGEEIEPVTMATVVVEKSTPGFAFASATWHFSTERLPDEARGDLFAVTRAYFRRVNVKEEWVLRPLTDGERIEPGDQMEVQLSIRAKHAAEYVHLRDPRGAGFEPESTSSRYRRQTGLGYYEEIRDSGTNFFFEWLPAGEYTLKYRLRANLAGSFRVGPATLQSMYAPEFTAYSTGQVLDVSAGER